MQDERKESRKRTRKYFKNQPRHSKLYIIIQLQIHTYILLIVADIISSRNRTESACFYNSYSQIGNDYFAKNGDTTQSESIALPTTTSDKLQNRDEFIAHRIALNIHAKTESGCLGNTQQNIVGLVKLVLLVRSLVNKLTKIQRKCTLYDDLSKPQAQFWPVCLIPMAKRRVKVKVLVHLSFTYNGVQHTACTVNTQETDDNCLLEN